MKELTSDEWQIVKLLVQIGGVVVILFTVGLLAKGLDIDRSGIDLIDIVQTIIILLTGAANTGKLYARRNNHE